MDSAGLIAKVKIEGMLCLDSPLLIGDGFGSEGHSNEADIHVLKDKEGRPFIPATSLAGVIRSRFGENHPKDLTELLFGEINRKGGSDIQSAISFYDVLLNQAAIIVRDGVGIDDETGVGKEGAKYDYEAVERGACGIFHAGLTIRRFHRDRLPDWRSLVKELADLIASGFSVGALTAKGFGKVSVRDAKAYVYDFSRPADVSSWLLGRPSDEVYEGHSGGSMPKDRLVVDADFAVLHSLIVRDRDTNDKELKSDDKAHVNAVQMKSGDSYVIPGTTMKGVMRHRSRRILDVLGIGDDFLDELMGSAAEGKKKKSRFLVDEVYFRDGVTPALQSRNRIDRFTGGTMDSALFTEEPVWQKEPDKPVLHIHYEILKNPDGEATAKAEAEAGLALFLLKDLWTGHLAVGGEKSIGRGMLSGVSAVISYHGKKYRIEGKGKVTEGNAEELEACAKALVDYGKEAHEA